MTSQGEMLLLDLLLSVAYNTVPRNKDGVRDENVLEEVDKISERIERHRDIVSLQSVGKTQQNQ